MSRLVIGLGFRDQATAQSISEVLTSAIEKAAMPNVVTMLAVVDDKASHPGLLATVRAFPYQLKTVTAEAMRQADARTATRSERILRQRGVGSVCEATALAAAGTSARLAVSRIVSADRTATAAVSVTQDTVP